MKLLTCLLSLVIICSPVHASTESPDTPITAEAWLERLSNSLQSLNFSTSFVVVKNNHADPYHWFHGVNEDNDQLEILSLLNGPRRDILRKGSVVSYIEPELPPYSINSSQVSGPIPNIFSGDVDVLAQNYNFVSVGKSRILGHSAQIIRIEPKDSSKYGHWLWLDEKTGLLLKLAIVTKAGQQLEQIQFTHLDITEKLADSLIQLSHTELPKIVDIPEGFQNQKLSWKVNWLPEGFQKVSANRHRISSTKQPVEFVLFSDGLVDVSVYVTPSDEKTRPVDYVMDGATIALNLVDNGFEISVVGKIPSHTAKKIADSVVATPRRTR